MTMVLYGRARYAEQIVGMSASVESLNSGPAMGFPVSLEEHNQLGDRPRASKFTVRKV